MHDRILFVIRNHLEMVRFANKFDLDDKKQLMCLQNLSLENKGSVSLYTYLLRCKCNRTRLWNAHKKNSQLYTNTIAVLEGKRAPMDPEAIKNSHGFRNRRSNQGRTQKTS